MIGNTRTMTIDATSEHAERLVGRERANEAASVCHAPRRVIRGAKCHESVSLDWVRVVGPASMLDRAITYIDATFGAEGRKPGKGLWFYEATQRYACGIIIAYDVSKDDERSTFAVEVPGQALALLSLDNRVKLLDRLLWLGCHCTRLDVAIDVHADGVYLAESVREACQAGELARCKVWREVAQHSALDQTGLTVYLGQRGDMGSGRFVRVYDKGLETQTAGPNQWQRWETEFSGDVAAEVAKAIVTSPDWQDVALSYATGAVDFRVANGQRLSRRPVAPWFAEWLAGIEPKRVTIARPESTLETFSMWINRCVGPTLATMAHHAEKELADVFLELVGQVGPVAQGTARTVVWEYLKEHGIVEQPKLAEVA